MSRRPTYLEAIGEVHAAWRDLWRAIDRATWERDPLAWFLAVVVVSWVTACVLVLIYA